MKITITASDGRTFTGMNFKALESEVNAYEADLKLRKEQQEAERKAKEEKDAKLADYRKQTLKELNEMSKSFIDKAKAFENETGRRLFYEYNLFGEYVIKDTNNTLDMAFGSFINDFVNLVRMK